MLQKETENKFPQLISNILIKLVLVILSFGLISCTVTYNKLEQNKIIKTLEEVSLKYREVEKLLVVIVDTQEMYFLKKGIISHKYAISTSLYGTGSEVNSLQTPLGRHVISEKIGTGLPLGAVLKGRKWTGAIANIIKEPIDTSFDVVTSRILWLKGLEEGLNLGPGVDSKSRFIYIHGTAEEGLIGRPSSDGCVRMYNDDVIALFDLVDTSTEVWIN